MPRANWKGHLAIDALTCAVSLHAAASTADRISFHTLNRATGNRVRRRYVDRETEAPVESEDQVKGYEIAPDEYVILEPEDIASAVPDSDKTLRIEAFLDLDEIDPTYFDKPYFLMPATRDAAEAFALIREGLRTKKVAAVARAILFRRVRSVLIRPNEQGLIGHTLNFDYEVRPATEAFSGIRDIKIEGEMLDLAKHIISTKKGSFEPADFTDRYDDALAELVKAKSEGRKIKPPKPAKTTKVVDLLDALRQSAGKPTPAKKPSPRRKAS